MEYPIEFNILFAANGKGDGFILDAPEFVYVEDLIDSDYLSDNINNMDDIPASLGVYSAKMSIHMEESFWQLSLSPMIEVVGYIDNVTQLLKLEKFPEKIIAH